MLIKTINNTTKKYNTFFGANEKQHTNDWPFTYSRVSNVGGSWIDWQSSLVFVLQLLDVFFVKNRQEKLGVVVSKSDSWKNKGFWIYTHFSNIFLWFRLRIINDLDNQIRKKSNTENKHYIFLY